VWDLEKRIKTVIAIGVGVRCDDAGEDTIVAPILERLGYRLERAKTNTGMARPIVATAQPRQEMVNA